MKFPTLNKMLYETGTLSNDAHTSVGHMCLPRDLSFLNRRGYASTDRKGVPWVYRTLFTVYAQDFLGKEAALDTDDTGSASDETASETAAAADFSTSLDIQICANNWVMRNAAVKWHAARNKMLRDAGVKRKHMGAYANEIRYNWDGASDAFIAPLDGSGGAITGGTWDTTKIFTDDRAAGFQLKLTGAAQTEDSAESGLTAQQIGYSYLASRATVPADSNLESSDVPADHSLLRQLLADHSTDGSLTDEIAGNVQDEQDNPPYDLFSADDVNHDITEEYFGGRAIAGKGSALGSVVVDVPFGICNIRARHSGATDQNIVDEVMFTAEVTDIYPMQG